MKWQPTRFTTMREFDFTNILIGIVSLAGAVFIHVISPNFYRGTGIPEIMFVLVMIVLFVGSNGWWIWRESQFEDITITQENEDGYNNFIGNDGDIYNGEANNQNSQEEDGR